MHERGAAERRNPVAVHVCFITASLQELQTPAMREWRGNCRYLSSNGQPMLELENQTNVTNVKGALFQGSYLLLHETHNSCYILVSYFLSFFLKNNCINKNEWIQVQYIWTKPKAQNLPLLWTAVHFLQPPNDVRALEWCNSLSSGTQSLQQIIAGHI